MWLRTTRLGVRVPPGAPRMLRKHLLILVYAFILSGLSYFYFTNCISSKEGFCFIFGNFGSVFLETLFFYLYGFSNTFNGANMWAFLTSLLLFYYLLTVIFFYSADFIHYVRSFSFTLTTDRRPVNYYLGILTYGLSFAILCIFTILFTQGYVAFKIGEVF